MIRKKTTALTGVALTAVSLLACGAGGGDAPDALRASPPDVLGFSVHPRQPFSYGEVVVHNRTQEQVKLESVRMIDASPGLRIVRAYALGPNRTLNGRRIVAFSGQHVWPKTEAKRIRPLRPLRGHPVPSQDTGQGHRGVELWLKMQVPKRGVYRVRHFELTYDVDSATNSLSFTHTLIACGRRDITKSCTPHTWHTGLE